MRRAVRLSVSILGWALVATEVQAQNWVNLTPASGPAPAARRNASAILDAPHNRMVIFGGFSVGYLNDIWAFNLSSYTWTNLTPASGPAPAPRLTPASIYDPDGHRMVTWSGQGNGAFFNDVWAFDLNTNTWSQFTPTGGPPQIRYGVGYTWDPLAKELVTFAGFTNLGRFDDVWRFKPSASTWINVSPGSGPLARCLHAACYDAQKHRMIMYAGQNNSGPLDDIWSLDLNTNTWTDITPAVKPSARYFSPVVYDTDHNRLTMFGGQGLIGFNREVWAFDLWTNKWTQFTMHGVPPTPRAASAAIYNQPQDCMMIFGGNDGVVSNEVWAVADLSDVTTSVGSPASSLGLRAFPNPFNPATNVEFALPAPGRVVLRVYDASGARVRTLADGFQSQGAHRVAWDGRNEHGLRVASGVYLLRIEAAGQSITRKLTLLK
jgi:hypothetical protein